MQINTDLTGLLGVTLAMFALLVRVPRVQAFPPLRRAAVLGAAIVLVSIPLWGLSLAGFVRGITSDLSIATLVLLALALLRTLSDCELIADYPLERNLVAGQHSPLYQRGARGDLSLIRSQKSPSVPLCQRGKWAAFSNGFFGLNEEANRLLMLRAIAIAAVLFYPLALGFSAFDPYRLGYGNLWFMVILLGLAIWSVLRYSTFFSLCIALAVAAWSAGWYESPNLWDYLLDPWLAIYAIVVQGKYWWAQQKIVH